MDCTSEQAATTGGPHDTPLSLAADLRAVRAALAERRRREALGPHQVWLPEQVSADGTVFYAASSTGDAN